MSNSESTFKKWELGLMACLGIIAMALITVAVVPSLRNSVKNAFLSANRDILAKVSGRLSADGPQITVLKIKSKNTIFIEIYSQEESGELVLMSKIPLFDARDGHVLMQGNATNLAITDVDKDGQLEIVVPTYDDQSVPRLNIFRYNPLNKAFDRATAPADSISK